MRGHIQRRGGSSWRLYVDGPPNPTTGERRQICRTVRGSRQDAEDALARLIIEVGRADAITDDVTVAQTVQAWLTVVELAVTTRRDYLSAIKHLPAWINNERLHRIRPHHLDRLYADLRAGGLNPPRIRRVHNILSAAFAQAVKWQWIARNPARDASPPPVPRARVKAPTADEVRRLVAALDGDLLVWLRLDASLGARRGEVCGLRWSDLDLDAGQVTVRTSLADGGRGIGVIAKGTKTGRDRTVALDRTTIQMLTAHRRRFLEHALAAGIHPTPDPWVFTNDAAGLTPWRPDYVTHRLRDIRRDLGLSDAVTAKGVRHFVATQLLAGGVDVRTVAGRLGHARTSTTLDVYADFVPARDREAADHLERLLG